VAASTAFLVAAAHLRPLRSFLRLAPLTAGGWLLVLAACGASVAIARTLAAGKPTARRDAWQGAAVVRHAA
jgi:hypothetical protein